MVFLWEEALPDQKVFPRPKAVMTFLKYFILLMAFLLCLAVVVCIFWLVESPGTSDQHGDLNNSAQMKDQQNQIVE